MSIFTRFKDIVSANLNAILDKAEDPERMLRQIIREMEDTQVELKASCAAAMANRKKAERDLEDVRGRRDEWIRRAELAVEKDREDLAREALRQKKALNERIEALEEQQRQQSDIVNQYKSDLGELEAKIQQARNKYQTLLERQEHAVQKKRAQEGIRRSEEIEAARKFSEYESRIDRLEAEADLTNVAPKKTIHDEFAELESNDEIDRELAELKQKKASSQ